MKIKNEGFTIVELMIVVSIIGILASVSSVYFGYYRAKSKSTEAKLALSSIYTSEQTFFNAFDIYSNCLADMGYEVAGSNNRHYAIGFPNIDAKIDAMAYDMAVRNGLGDGLCVPNLTPIEGQSFYLATSGAGEFLINSKAIFKEGITNYDAELTTANIGTVEEGLGIQSDPSTTVFVVPALGIISTEKAAPQDASLWTINSNKLLIQHRKGF